MVQLLRKTDRYFINTIDKRYKVTSKSVSSAINKFHSKIGNHFMTRVEVEYIKDDGIICYIPIPVQYLNKLNSRCLKEKNIIT